MEGRVDDRVFWMRWDANLLRYERALVGVRSRCV
jgi:hypothetical protein